MTNFEAITQSSETLADTIIFTEAREMGNKYCKYKSECLKRLDGGLDIVADECCQCLIDYLNAEA